MSCNVFPASCLDPSVIFAGVYNPRCGGFADPSDFQAEKTIVGEQFKELINNFGVEINYYVNGFNLSAMDALYGEQPLQEYFGPVVMKAYLELEESITLSQFGISSEDELTLFVAIDDFTDAFSLSSYVFTQNGQRVEPKSDDLIEITALGCDRPGDRGAKIFQITEAMDQMTQEGLNPIMGHYIWRLKAKRYETSHETNAPQEPGYDQVYDNTFSGKLSSTLFPSLTTTEKKYPHDVDVTSKEDVYDMDNTDNNIYGDYY